MTWWWCENQKGVSDISPTLQESQNKIFTIVWSDFVYWFQLFIIQICTLMDDSTFASRKSSLRAFIWYTVYIAPFHQKCHLRPSGSHPWCSSSPEKWPAVLTHQEIQEAPVTQIHSYFMTHTHTHTHTNMHKFFYLWFASFKASGLLST